ncbi:hypothetical protein [Vibrio phage vB_ValP_IME234]|nr:hypothetical protein [Vibrio phage vB_ValP_IME234]BBI55022.1 hypothetical protein KIT05_32 [Vibrio phage KIT05]
MKVLMIVSKKDTSCCVLVKEYGYLIFDMEHTQDCLDAFNKLEDNHNYKIVVKEIQWRDA